MSELGGQISQVTSLEGVHTPFVSPDGSKIAILHSNDMTPTELYIIDAKKGATERRITHSQPKEFSDYQWIRPQYVTFKSHIDGVTLHGRLILPHSLDESKKYPAILGPVYSNTVRNAWSGRYSMLQQYLVQEGQYIIMQIDIRGSSGYGNTFREQFKYEVGGIDIEDLHSGVKYIKTISYVDPERIGIWGSSYGGLLTMMSLFKKPGVYKAGVAGAPGGSWHALTRNVSFFGRPETHSEIYKKGSCYSYGEDLTDHLMIIHGMQDSVVLFKDSVDIVEKLMMLGKDFDFIAVPSATHGWSRKDYVAAYLFKKLVDHFDRYLGRGPR
jgi:dipeptidyl-peptidase-4